MHKYRTHNCNELTKNMVGQKVKLSGWVHRRRDHGNLLFIDLRDHYGITQLVFTDQDLDLKVKASHLRYESVITIEGNVVARSAETINTSLNTGEIEIAVEKYILESEADMLPLNVNSEQEAPEDIRLKYRFLDLRKEKMHNNIMLRSKIIEYIRKYMTDLNFIEFQTPILTASSPEGARDFLVPSRLHPGKFYALPQAPQQFKQMLMMSGFDKYFQIAPCFRDEDSRADRSPGEFYQLDMEMSFVTQEEIFATLEPLMFELFSKFGDKKVAKPPFARIAYDEAMLKYGSDKPDLRNPIEITDVTKIFADSAFAVFTKAIEKGSVVRAIPGFKVVSKSRKFFDELGNFAIEEGASGLGYISFTEEGEAKGPIAKFLNDEQIKLLKGQMNLQNGDAVFFVCAKQSEAARLSGKIRNKLGVDLELIDYNRFEFCWIIDFPFYELDEENNKIDFSHNPFSMPQGGIDGLLKAKTQEDLLAIKALQYDIVCNGIELSSGAIRNHKPDLMYKAFEIAGYSQQEVDKEFGGMIRAFKFGAPPHGGIAPGIDRIVMLIADTVNIREVIAFPLNQQAEDLLMGAPNYAEEKQLRELNIMLSPSVRNKLKEKT